ncbi:MAG: hypothetical protein P8Z80_06625 [Pseudolabrys sp.]
MRRVGAERTVAPVVCAAVPTTKVILAGEYKVAESTVASAISVSTVASVATLLAGSIS